MMMKSSVLLVIVATTGLAQAGSAVVHSTVQEDFTISYARPSGEPASTSLSKGASATGYTSVEVPDRGTTAITVSDATGEKVAKGTVADNGTYLLRPNKKGYALERAGSGTQGWQPYPGVVIVNTLPAAYKIDLFGHLGKIGLKDVKLGTTFAAKQAVKIPSGDDRFKVVIRLPDGSTVDCAAMVNVGRYHVIHMTYDDKVTVSQLGYIETPDTKPKSK
jgi:hypothetical protein